MPSLRVICLALALVSTAACSQNSLSPATLPNRVDTVTVGALVGTPITVPSGFSVAENQVVRTDQSSAFDFAYNVEPGSSGRRVFLPLGVLGLGSNGTADPGLQLTAQAFDAITIAESNGYLTRDTIPVAVGNVFFVRSRVVCTSLGVPQYAKLEILAFPDSVTVRFRVLTDNNCGYRGLQPGVPTK